VTIVDKPAEYAQAARILDWLRAQLCVMPGNRDDRGALRAAFAARLPEDCHGEFVQYAIVREHACAIMLDTVSTQSKKGRLCKARLAHLGEMLNDAGNRQVVVFMHHPPFEIAEAPVSFRDTEMRGISIAGTAIEQRAAKSPASMHQRSRVWRLICARAGRQACRRALSGYTSGVDLQTM
jgi:hypothetical protein